MAAAVATFRTCALAVLRNRVSGKVISLKTAAAAAGSDANSQKRWNSGSPIFNSNAKYPEFEISKDPTEWSYVERLLRDKIIPEPPSDKQEFASGWKPQLMEKAKDLPYFVQRSKNHMMPVYLLHSYRGSRKVTKLKNIEGDIWLLEKHLKEYLQERYKRNVGVRVNEPAGFLKFRGDYVTAIREWMESKGL